MTIIYLVVIRALGEAHLAYSTVEAAQAAVRAGQGDAIFKVALDHGADKLLADYKPYCAYIIHGEPEKDRAHITALVDTFQPGSVLGAMRPDAYYAYTWAQAEEEAIRLGREMVGEWRRE